MNQNNPTKTLLGIKFFAFALFPLFALGVAVSLGLAQSESAQSPILTPIACPSCTSPTPTATPSCSCKPTPTATPPLNTPLNDLGPGTYTRDGESEQGGLYPDGSNQRPMDHDIAGQAIAAAITPRGPDGSPTPPAQGGKIGLLALGMSNANMEFSGGHEFADDAFINRANGQIPLDHPDKAKADSVVLVSGAIGGCAAVDWADATNDCWADAKTLFTDAGLSRLQVEVIWMEQAVSHPSGEFRESAQYLQTLLRRIAQNIFKKFPNCQIVFLSTRTHALTTTKPQNPEPYAYETGFANKWLIEEQITGNANLCFKNPNDPDSCPDGVQAPYLCWGSYHWVNGPIPRSDLKTWDCWDVQEDRSHPTACGVHKVADQLLAFFETNPIATPWYLRENSPDVTITCPANFSVCSNSPYTVQFCADVRGGNGLLRYSWDFDDGDFDYDNPTPTKSFPVSGTYNVHLTVVDADGNHGQDTITIQVPPP